MLPWSATLELPGGEAPYNARMYGGRPTLELPTLELPWTPVGHMYVYFWGATYPRAACLPWGENAYPGAGKAPWSRKTPPLQQPTLDLGMKS